MRLNMIPVLRSRHPLPKIIDNTGHRGILWMLSVLTRISRRAVALSLIVNFSVFGQETKIGHEPGLAPSSTRWRLDVVESSEELHETLQEMPALTFGVARSPHLTITVNDAMKYQQMDGFGASLTDSSAWLLSH